MEEDHLKKISSVTQEEIRKKELLSILDEYFSRGVSQKKFIDVARIPLICQDISNIHQSISEIKDNITWIVRLVVGGVILAILAMVLK